MSAFGSSLNIPKLPGLPELPELPAAPELPDIAPPPMPTLPGMPGTPDRARHVDKMVAANRIKTPTHDAEKRTTPRMSIEELNQSDPDELRDRFLNSKYDTRTPLQQVLDLVDLPRNTIANLVFHDAAREQGAKGETAAFGMPRVSVSDGLRNMGVENRVALALGGFAGDVALDPLTYLGPAGWGVKVGKTSLRGVGAKTLQSAIKEGAAGGLRAVSDDAARGVLKAAGLGEAPLAEDALSKAVFGDFSKSKVERVFSKVGGEKTATGGIFSKLAEKAKTADNPLEHEAIDAVKSYVEKYGRGTGPGLKIGSGGSEIAHVPFTDWTVQVPGFTPTGKATRAALAIAKDKQLGDVAPELNDIGQHVNQVRAFNETAKAESDARVAQMTELEDKLKEVGADPAIETEIKNLKQQHSDALNAYIEQSNAHGEALRGKIDAWLQNPKASRANANSILAAGEKYKEVQATLEKLNAEKDYWDRAVKTYGSVKGDVNASVQKSSETLNRIVAQMQGGEKPSVRVGKWRTLDDPQLHSELNDIEMDFIPPEEIGGAITEHEHTELWNKLRAKLKALPKDSPFRDEVRTELELLALRRIGENPVTGGGVDRTSITRGLLNTTPDGSKLVLNSDPQVQARVFEAARPLLDAIEEDTKAIKRLGAGGRVHGEDILGGQQGLFRPEEAQSSKDVSEINAIKQRLAANRDELRKVTAPLRGDMPNPDAVRVYHGSTHQTPSLDPVHSNQKNLKAVWFSDNPDTARNFGKNVISTTVDKSKLFDPSNPEHMAALEAALPDRPDLTKLVRAGDNFAQESEPVHQALVGLGFKGHIGQEGTNPGKTYAVYDKSLIGVPDVVRSSAPLQTTEEFEQAVHANAMANLDTRTKQLYELGEKDPQLATATAESLSRLADATMNYRDILGGTLGMHISGPLKDAVEIAKRTLGTSDDIVAMSTIGQLESAARSITKGDPNVLSKTLSSLDRRLRPYFGARHGSNAALMAHVRSDIRNYAQTGAHFGAAYMDGVRAALRTAGITDPKMADDAGILAGMFLHQLQDPAAKFALEVPELKDGVETGKMVPSMLKTRMEGPEGLMTRLRTQLGPQKSEEFFANLKKVAGDAKGALDSIKDEGLKEYLLGNVMETGYVPHTLAADTAQMLSLQKKSPEWRNPAMGGKGPKESFQRQRLSNLYVFDDTRPGMAGNKESFLEADRWVQDAGLGTPEGQEAFRIEHGQQKLDRAMELLGRIERYDRLPEKPPPRVMDLYTTNEYIRQGRFAQFAGGKNGFFEERLPIFMANRMAMNERAKGMQDLLAMRSMEELPIKPESLSKWSQMVAGKGTQNVTLKTGEPATIRKATGRFGGDVLVIEARGKTWRSLDPSLKKYDDNPVVKMVTGALQNSVVSEPMADFMEDVAKVWKDDNIAPMLSAISNATSVYRAMTLLHPSWYINDAIGNLTLMAQGGVNLTKWAKMLPKAIKIRRFKDHPEQMAALKVLLNGQEISGNVLAENAIAARIFDQHMANQGLTSAMFMGTKEARPSRMHAYGVTEGMKKDWNWRAAQALGGGGDPSMYRKGAVNAMAAVDLGWDQAKRRIFEPWMKGNGLMNDTMRLAAFMTMIDDGMDAASAAEKMRRVMYDLGDMTHFEQKVMRTVAPFYAWARSNLSYQVRQFFNDPKWAAAFPKVKEALEQALAGEQQIPESMRPSWMRAALATQIGTDPNSRYALMLGNTMPQLESLNLLQSATGTQGAMNAGRYLLSNLNPVLGVPAELASGTDFYSGRSITGTPGTGDTTAGEFVAGAIRPLAEYGPGGRVAKAFTQGGAFQGISRAVAGGRIQAFDDARLQTTKAREIRDQVEDLRRGITMAERNGDHRTSVRSRAQLLKVYEEALRLGLDKDVQVPRWAKNALAGMPQG